MKERIPFYEHQARNKRAVRLLWLILILVFIITGGAITAYFQYAFNSKVSQKAVLLGSLSGGVFGLVYILSAYYLAGPFLLKKVCARPINERNEREVILRNVVEEIAIAAGVPPPDVYLIDKPNWLNAFASGKSEKDASICITTGLLMTLNREELQGVIGHEISHIKSHDTKLKLAYLAATGLLATIATITWVLFGSSLIMAGRIKPRTKKEEWIRISYLLSCVIFGGIAIITKITSFFAKLLSLAIGRRQEFLADFGSVEFTRNPGALARALIKIRDAHLPQPKISFAEAPFFISNPQLKEIRKPNFFERLFSTHPPIEDRIKKLVSTGAEIIE